MVGTKTSWRLFRARWSDRMAGRIRRWRTRLRRSRCSSCGLLGGYNRPYASKKLADLEEIPAMVRDEWAGALRNARRLGKFGRNEYDWRYYHEMGLATTRLGVACGVGDRRGSHSSWTVPGPRQSDADFFAMNVPGALVTERQPGTIIGKPIGVVQTFVWELVRPHDCPHHVKHRPGLTPAQHHASWISRWPRRRTELFAALAALGAVVGLVSFLLDRLG